MALNPSPIVALAVETGKGVALEQRRDYAGSGATHQLDAGELRAERLEREVMRDVVGGTAFVAGEAAHEEPGVHLASSSVMRFVRFSSWS